MPYCQQAAVLQRVADSIRCTVATLPPEWLSLVAQATKDAAADIVTILANKNFSGQQIVSADQFAVWQERLAFVIALERGSVLTTYNQEQVKLLDPREMLEKLGVLLINGEPVAPTGTVIGGLASGTLSAIDEAGCRYDRLSGRWPGDC